MKRTKFGEAFASARKAGKKTFEFGGKSYTTETKEEKARTTADKAVRKFGANTVPGKRQSEPKMGVGAISTPETKAMKMAKSAVRKFSANAVPGKRQPKPKIGGGAISVTRSKESSAISKLPPSLKAAYKAAKISRETPAFELKPSRASLRKKTE
jgi:hypothetical protein